MFFVTKAKIEREIDRLLTKFERVSTRVQAHLDQDKIIGSLMGPNEVALTLAKNSAEIQVRLHEAGVQARFGTRPLRSVAGDLPAVSKVADGYSRLLDQMDAANAAGKAAAGKF